MTGFRVLLIAFGVVTGTWLLSSWGKENAGPLFSPQSFSYKVESVTYAGGLTDVGYTDSLKTFHLEFYHNPVYENYLFINLSGASYWAPGVYAAATIL